MYIILAAAAIKPLIRGIILTALLFLYAQSGSGQTPPASWDLEITICTDNHYLDLTEPPVNAPDGSGGTQWIVYEGVGSGTFSPTIGPQTTISNISLEENWYRYTRPGGGYIYIKITRLPPPNIYILTGPEIICGDEDGTLVLSGSDPGYSYILYRGDDPAVAGVAGTGGALEWIVSESGTYKVLAEASPDCSEWMDGEVEITIQPFPEPFDLTTTPADGHFCAGSTVAVRLANSQTGVSYQLYHDGFTSGSPRAGSSGSSITWNVDEEGEYWVIGTFVDTGCEIEMNNRVTTTEMPVPKVFNMSPAAGSFCSDNPGIDITLSGSEADMSYQLKRGGSDYFGPIDGDSDPINWEVNQAGTYTVIATNTLNECTTLMGGSSVITSLQNYTLSGVPNDYYCEGEAGVSLRLSGSQTGVNYRLFKDGTHQESLAGTGAALTWTNRTAGVYQVYARKDGVDCLMGSVTVTMVPKPGTVSPAGPICLGQSVQLNASGGESYSWSPPETLDNSNIANPFATPAESGVKTYSVLITDDDKGCTNTLSVDVTVHSLPVANAGADQEICLEESVQLQASGGGSYSWAPSTGLSATNISNPEADPGSTTTYTVTVTDANSCSASDDVTVTVNPLPSVNAGADRTICAGQSTTLTVTGNADSYEWSPGGATTESITVSPLSTRDYTVTGIFAATGCEVSDEVRVNVNPLPVKYSVTATNDGEFCENTEGVTIGLTNSQSNIDYRLRLEDVETVQTQTGTGGEFSFDDPVNVEGTYTVRAINTTTGCAAWMTGEAVVTENPLPGPASPISGTKTVCPLSTQAYSIPAIDDATGYVWTLPPNAVKVSGEGTNSIEVWFPANAQSGTITVRGSNDCGTGSSSTANITISPFPAAAGAISGPAEVCANTTGIGYSIAPVEHASSYTWQVPPGAVIFGSSTGNSITVDFPAGSSSGDVIVTPVNSCGTGTPRTLAVTVTPRPNLFIAPPAQLDCSPKTVTISASSTTTGVTWQWEAFGGGNIVSGDDSPKLVVDRPGTYQATVAINGCSTVGSVDVTRNTARPENVQITKSASTITCDIQQITLTASADSDDPVSYSWTPLDGGNIVSGENTSTATVNREGTYMVIATNSVTSCTAAPKSETIGENTTPPDLSGITLSASGDITCDTKEVELSANQPLPGDFADFIWSSDEGNWIDDATLPTPKVNTAGTYKLTVTGTNGCKSEKTVDVGENTTPPEIINFTDPPENLTCTRTQVRLTGNAVNSTRLWTGPVGATITNETGTETLVDMQGTYKLTVTSNINGCLAERIVQVTENKAVPTGVNISPFDHLACNRETTTLTGTSTTSDATFRWEADDVGNIIAGSTSATATVDAAGNYTVFAKHPVTGCEASKATDVNFLDDKPNIFELVVPEDITCYNQQTGVTLISGVSPEGSELLWSGPGTIDNSTSLNPTVYVPGTYTLTARHPDTGCEIDKSAEVLGNLTPPVITTFGGPYTVTCADPIVTITPVIPDGNHGYQWTTAGGTISGDLTQKNVNVSSGGTYSLTVTDIDNGCKVTQSLPVAENKTPPDITVDDSPPNITCANPTSQVFGTSTTPGATYEWSGPGIVGDYESETATVNQAGTYTLTVTNPVNGCTASGPTVVKATVTDPVKPIILTPAPLTCREEWTTLSVSNVPDLTGVDFKWTTDDGGTISFDNAPGTSVNAVGTYTVTVTDQITGCTNFSDVTVTRDERVADVDIPGGPFPLTCTDIDVGLTLTGITDGVNPVWSTEGGNITAGREEFTATVNAPGTYRLTVEHLVSGCPSSEEVVVEAADDIPGINIDQYSYTLTCGIDEVTISAEPIPVGLDFQWLLDDIPINDENFNLDVKVPGTYVFEVTDAAGCTNRAEITVVEDKTPPTFVISTPDEFTCLIEEVQLNATVTSAGAVTYQWEPLDASGFIDSGENTRNPVVSAPGEYRLNVTKISNGCVATDVIEVFENIDEPGAFIAPPHELTCDREEVILLGTSNIEGSTYNWTSDQPITSIQYRFARVRFPGVYDLEVTHPVTGCKSTASITVTQNIALPQNIQITPVQPVDRTLTCSVTSITLTGSSDLDGASYSWTNPAGVTISSTDVAVATEPGTYTLRVTNEDTGCSDTEVVEVHENVTAPDPPSVTEDIFTCFGEDNEMLTATGTNIRWYSHSSLRDEYFLTDENSFTPPGSISNPGNYYYYVTSTSSTYGCESEPTQVMYTVRELPSPPIGVNEQVCKDGANPELTAIGNNIHWYADNNPDTEHFANGNAYTPGDTDPGTHTYYITRTDDSGCESNRGEVKLTIHPRPSAPAISGSPAETCENSSNPMFTAQGTNIRWYATATSAPVINTGNQYTSGKTTPGKFNYYATRTSTFGCESFRETATLTINPLPEPYGVMGGGEFCPDSDGVEIWLAGSDTGVSYELLLNGYSTDPGQVETGTGSEISFGKQFAEGTYAIRATNETTSCTSLMTDEVVVAKSLLPAAATTLVGPRSTCPGTTLTFSTAFIERADSYSWSVPAPATITSGMNTNTITVNFPANAVSGRISVRGVNDCGQGIAYSDDITVRPLPSAAGVITGDDNVCPGDMNVAYRIDPVANATSYTWEIPTGAVLFGTYDEGRGIEVNFPIGAESGDITVTPANSCGTGTPRVLPVTVTPLPAITMSEPSDQLDCSDNTVSLSASSTTPNVTWLWTATQGGHVTPGEETGTDIEIDRPGRYKVTATADGCSAFRERIIARVTDYPEGINITRSGETITCNTPTMTLIASTTSTFPVSYEWEATGGGNIVSGRFTATPEIDRGGIYSVIVTNQNTECSADPAFITISENTVSPDVSDLDMLVSGHLSCTNSQVQLSTDPSLPAGFSSFAWSSEDGNISNPASPTPMVDAPGTYKLTVTGTNGCTSEKTVRVYADNRLPENVSIDTPAMINCLSDVVQLSGNAAPSGVTYQWTGPGILSGGSSATPVVNQPGEYIMTVTHPQSGCTVTETALVNEDRSEPVISMPALPEQITCLNQDTGLELNTTVTPENSILNWEGPGTINNRGTANPTVFQPGVYTLTARHPETGCESSASAEVTANLTEPVIISFNDPGTITCTTTQVTIDPDLSDGSFTYKWNRVPEGTGIVGSTTNRTVVVSEAGTYRLTVIDSDNGCSTSGTITASVNKVPPDVTVDDNPPKITCTNSTSQLYGTSTTPDVTYAWTGPGTITDAGTQTPVVNQQGTYTLTITNPANGCTASANVDVTANLTDPPVPVVVTPEPLTCTKLWTDLQVSPYIDGVDYLWTTAGSGTIINNTSDVASVNEEGTYTITLTDRNNGCTSSANTTVTRNTGTTDVEITGGPYILTCETVTLTLTGSSSDGISPEWSTVGGNITSDKRQMNVQVNASGDYTLTVLHPVTGCPSSATITVGQTLDVPQVDIDPYPATLTCGTTEVRIEGRPVNPDHDYEWSTGNGFIVADDDSHEPLVNKAGTYVLTVTDPITGCANRASVTVEDDKTAATFTIEKPAKLTCTVQEIQLRSTLTSSDTQVAYSWTTSGSGSIRPGDENVARPMVTAPGTYTLTVTKDRNQCVSSKSVTVTENKTLPQVSVNTAPDMLTCERSEVVLSGSSTTEGATFRWSSDDGYPVVNPLTRFPRVSNPGWYTLTVTHPESGCKDFRNTQVKLDTLSPHVHIEAPSVVLTCNVTSVRLEGSSDTPGVSYLWTGPEPVENAESSVVLVTEPGRYFLRVKRDITGCTSTAFVDVLEDREPAAAPPALTGYNCDGQSSTTLTATGDNIRWYSNGNLLPEDLLKEGNTYTPTVTAPGSYYYYITQTGDNGCESISTQVTYTVRSLPASPAGTGNEVCHGDATPRLRAYGTNIRWYDLPDGTEISTGEYYTPPVTSAGNHVYYASQTDEHGCESNFTEITLSIRPKPSAPVITETPLTACEGTTNPAFSAQGNNISWYSSPASTTPLLNASQFTSEEFLPGTWDYQVSQTSDFGCESDRSVATLVINPSPEKFQVTGGGIFCENSAGVAVGLDNSAVEVEYTLWLNNTTEMSTMTGTGNSIDFGMINKPGTFTATAKDLNSCMTTMNGSVTASVTLLPGRPEAISGQEAVCRTSTGVVYEIPAVTGATSYNWELPAGATISAGSGTRSVRVDYSETAESGNIRVRAVNNCGDGPVSGDLHVLVTSLPDPAGPITATANNTSICRGDNNDILFEVAEIANASEYEWQIPAGASIVQGQGSRSITVRFAPEAATGNQEVRVRGVNDCGTGAYSGPHEITVHAPPDISAGNDQYLCSDQATLSGTAIPAGGSATWTIASGDAVLSDNSVNNPTVTSLAMGENNLAYTVTLNACTVSDTVRLYNNKVLVDAGANRTICSEDVILQGTVPPQGTTGTWSVQSGGAAFQSSTQYNTRAFNFGPDNNVLYWTINKNGCQSRDSVIITNNGTGPVNAGADLSTCDSRAALDAMAPAIGQGEWQIISGKANFVNREDPKTSVDGLERGVNKLAWVVTNLNCVSADTVTVTNYELDITAGIDQELCDTRFTMNATPTPQGGTGEWSVIVGSASFDDYDRYNTRVTGLSRGVNKLEWKIAKDGCIFRDTLTLLNNMPTIARAGANQDIMGTSTVLEANMPVVGTASWSVITGSGTFVNNENPNTVVNDLSPGDNILRWSITYENCVSESDVKITNRALDDLNAGEDQMICSSETRLSAEQPMYGYGVWSVRKGSARFENNEQTNTRVSNLAQGENILRWSVFIGSLEHYDEVTILNNTPTQATAGMDRSICADSFILQGSNPTIGTGNWEVESGSGVFEDETLHNSEVTGLSRGDNIFRWTITNENCVSSDVVTITNDIPTTPDAGPDQETCEGSVWLTPNTPADGSTAEWTVLRGGGVFEGNFVRNLANGENHLIYTMRKNTCVLRDTVVITNYKPSTANAGANMNVCINSANLTANRPNLALGETGIWEVISGSATFGDISSPTTEVTGLSGGVNVLRWTIENQGCTSHDEITISYDFVQADAGSDVVTCESELILNANNPGPGIGQWTVRGGSGSAVFESPTSSNSRVYNLDRGNNILRWTITNNNCVSISEISVTNNSPSPAYAGADQMICADTTRMVARQPLIGTGTWSVINGGGNFENEVLNNTRISAVGPGLNTFRWTIENQGCFSVDEVTIRNSKPVDVFAGDNRVLCDDQVQLAAIDPEQGSGMWSIVKGGGIMENLYSGTTSVADLAPDENIFRWTVTDGQCTEYDEVRVVNNKPTNAYAGVDKSVCADNTVLEGNIPLQGAGRWSIISGSGVFEDETINNTSISEMTRGTNILRWTITKANCTSSDDVFISNDTPSTPNAGADLVICDDTTPLNGNIPAVGTGRWTLLSGSGSFEDPMRHNTTISDVGQGTNVLRWTITNKNCSLYDQVEVKNNQTDVYAGPDQLVYTDRALLSGNVPARGSGVWTLDAGGGTILQPTSTETWVEGLSQGINTFLWSVNIDGCISSDDIIISYFPQATATFTASPSDGCPPLDVSFTKTTTEDFQFRWELGEDGITSLEENPSHTYHNPGSYVARLYITGPDGKEIMGERVIKVHVPPVADFEIAPTELFIPGKELRTYNYSFNATDYLWNFGDGNTSTEINPVHLYDEPGQYFVSLRTWSAENCADSLFSDVPVNVERKAIVQFPSAFTPNPAGSSDGRYNRNDFSNHVFYPVIITGDIDEYSMEIFNRWGLKLFESNDIEIGWDGYYRGQLVAEDLYIFRVTGRLNNGDKFTKTGDFLLMRRD